MSLKTGTINNCQKCHASYGQYNDKLYSDYSEFWGEFSYLEEGRVKEPKGLCQFCNSKSKYCIIK